MPGRRPTKTEIAEIRVRRDAGESTRTIASHVGRCRNTVRKILKSDDFSDPEVVRLINKFKERELGELHGIGGLAREILLDYLDDVLEGEKEPNPIAITAILDRTFQQRRLLEGNSTGNIDVRATTKEIEDIERRIAEIEEEEKNLLKQTEINLPTTI
jgi:predicted transcriptional regulator